MVDLRPGSAKLRDRALRIIEAAGSVSREEAERLYEATDGEVKTAIVMATCEVDVEDSRERLRAAGGHVRKALHGESSTEKCGANDFEK
jgi:N-acetylmuramic acid 6-phosphate etherase